MDAEMLKAMDRPIVLYGMGNGAERILDMLSRHGLAASAVFASDEFVRGQVFRGFPVMRYAEIREKFPDAVILLAFGSHLPAVMERFRAFSENPDFYAPALPVCDGPMWDAAFEKAHEAEIRAVYDALADDASRECFEAITEYRRTWRLSHLFSCQTPVREAYTDILRLGTEESLLDLGAYRGDTVQTFLQYAESYTHVIAVEPDDYSFRKLTAATEQFPRITRVHAAIGSTVGQTLFLQKGGRGSHAGEGKPLMMQSVDSLCESTRITFMNIDVEGQEAAALDGAQQTILRDRPKILLSAYHRSEDLFSLVPKILEIRPDYRVYLRHHEAIPDWDTNFYLI